MKRLSLLRASDCRRARWKNDGGWTTEIAREPADPASGFDWRVSIAEIERDGPFSLFEGVDRDLILLDGNGMELSIEGAGTQRIDARLQHVRFRGEAAVDCRLIAGPTRDFNVMAKRERIRADVLARPLVDSMVIFAERGAEWVVHAYAGHLEARDGNDAVAIAPGETLRVDFRAEGDGRLVLAGAGELVLVKLRPAPAA
jgi:environmental stress-induced protein Ves